VDLCGLIWIDLDLFTGSADLLGCVWACINKEHLQTTCLGISIVSFIQFT
jgi:hypothetical protein